MAGVLGLAAPPPLGAVNSWPPARAPCPHRLTASLRQATAPEVGQGAVRQARLPSGFKKEGGECSRMFHPLWQGWGHSGFSSRNPALPPNVCSQSIPAVTLVSPVSLRKVDSRVSLLTKA